jgi:hypothetical protein
MVSTPPSSASTARPAGEGRASGSIGNENGADGGGSSGGGGGGGGGGGRDSGQHGNANSSNINGNVRDMRKSTIKLQQMR